VSIDVGAIRSSEPSAAALVGAGGEFSDAISFGANLADIGQRLVDLLLRPLSDLTIPVDETVTTFEDAVPFDSPFTDPVDVEVLGVKIDFADFDLDGDGAPEGCSGSTAAPPICFRVWYDGVRRLAGVFDDYPTASNVAAGRFRVQQFPSETASSEDDQGRAVIGVAYDHRDPLDKRTEIFEAVFPIDSDPFAEGVSIEDSTLDAHFTIAQKGPDGAALKTLVLSARNRNPEVGFASVRYVGRFRDDADFWSGTAEGDPPSAENTFTNQCAVISTGDGTRQQDCLDAGVDAGGIEFVDFADLADVLLPEDLKESPAF
jgi:hypothetical protein